MKKRQKRAQPIALAPEHDELMVALLGNANSGKSSLVGVLTNPRVQRFVQYNDTEIAAVVTLDKENAADILDDGDGKSRAAVLNLAHEKATGRTSSITYNSISMCAGRRAITFVDLCGQEQYLRTTINGMCCSYPDYAMVCIEKITKMTREHIMIAHTLGVPFAVLITKIDIIPEDKLAAIVHKVRKLCERIRKQPLLIRRPDDLRLIAPESNHVPIMFISNATGRGIDEVLLQLGLLTPQRPHVVAGAFVIDATFHVAGSGLVVSGTAGVDFCVGDEVHVGHFNGHGFIKSRVRSIHDNFKNSIEALRVGARGCLCLNLAREHRRALRSGMVVVHDPGDVAPTKAFRAEVVIFENTHMTIRPGYQVYMNSGAIRNSIVFRHIHERKKMRGGDRAVVDIEFMRYRYCVLPGDKFLFREGATRGFGIVLADERTGSGQRDSN